jgi:peptide/nickel transport system ATP-binding protein
LAILGLLDPAARIEGSIHWFTQPSEGQDRAPKQELVGLSNRDFRSLRGREIAMIFQEPMTALNPVMTVGKQITEAIKAHPHTGDPRKLAVAALEAVGLPDASRRISDYPHQFSGGQRQRILIAMALVHKPKLLIADEPTTALDVTVQAQVLELLKSLQREFGLAMIFTSHDLAVIGQMADQVAVMRSGEIVETGPMREILIRPKNPYTQSLLSAVPTLRTDRTKPLAQLT